MPFVPAPNIVEVQFRTTWNNEQTMNRVMVDCLTTPTEAIIQDIVTEAGNWWQFNVLALTPPSLVLREVYGKSLETSPGPEATFSSGLPLAGTLGQASMPNNVSIAVSLRTGLTGRSARGRWFWQGLTEGQVADNEVNAGAAVSIVAAIDALVGAISLLGYALVIVSFRSGGVPRPGGPVYFVVNDALLVDTVVDSQRRRLPGRGR